MSNYSKIYWITRLDYLDHFLITLACSFFIMSFVWALWAWMFSDKFLADANEKKEIDDRRKRFTKKIKIFIPLGFLFLFINSFIPSKNEALLIMAGGKTLDYIQKDTSLSKIPYQTTQVISTMLENEIKKLKDGK